MAPRVTGGNEIPAGGDGAANELALEPVLQGSASWPCGRWGWSLVGHALACLAGLGRLSFLGHQGDEDARRSCIFGVLLRVFNRAVLGLAKPLQRPHYASYVHSKDGGS